MVKTEKDERVIVEIQNNEEYDYLQRILYGACKTIAQNLKRGEPYSLIKKVISWKSKTTWWLKGNKKQEDNTVVFFEKTVRAVNVYIYTYICIHIYSKPEYFLQPELQPEGPISWLGYWSWIPACPTIPFIWQCIFRPA